MSIKCIPRNVPLDVKTLVFEQFARVPQCPLSAIQVFEIAKFYFNFPTRHLPRRRFSEEKLRMFDYMLKSIPKLIVKKQLPYNLPSYSEVKLPIKCTRCRNINMSCDDVQYSLTSKGEIYHVVSCQEALEMSVDDATIDTVSVIVYEADKGTGTTYTSNDYRVMAVSI